jgi:hypothetical protein
MMDTMNGRLKRSYMQDHINEGGVTNVRYWWNGEAMHFPHGNPCKQWKTQLHWTDSNIVGEMQRTMMDQMTTPLEKEGGNVTGWTCLCLRICILRLKGLIVRCQNQTSDVEKMMYSYRHSNTMRWSKGRGYQVLPHFLSVLSSLEFR